MRDHEELRQIVTKHLEAYQPAILVMPSHRVARELMYQMDPISVPDTDHLPERLSWVRSNPDSRTPTFVQLVGFFAEPHQYRGHKAVIEMPFFSPVGQWQHDRKWRESMAVMERHRL